MAMAKGAEYQLKVDSPRLGDFMKRREAGREEYGRKNWSDFAESIRDVFANYIDASRFRRENGFRLYQSQGSIIAIAEIISRGELARRLQDETSDHIDRLEFSISRDSESKRILELHLGTVKISYDVQENEFQVKAGDNTRLQGKLFSLLNDDTLHPNPFKSAFHMLSNQFYTLNDSSTNVTKAIIDFGADIPYAEFHARTERKRRASADKIYRYQLSRK